jgi:dipeptidyl aminopeptidase/acylaminoacyl peptidase
MLIPGFPRRRCVARCAHVLLLVSTLTFLCDWGRQSEALSVTEAPMPALGPGRRIQPGIMLHEVLMRRRNGTSRIWIYIPEGAAGRKLPCVLIAPAGSRLFHGKSLGEGDIPEHLPYVRAGFIVLAYDIDGDTANQSVVTAARAFKDAEAGVSNARTALDYALARLPSVDPSRVYAAGHSSAATLALLFASRDPRIKACVAYAPVCDTVRFIGRFSQTLSASIPGFAEFFEQSSPDRNTIPLKCPVFLFHADDDSIVGAREISDFVDILETTNSRVTFVRVTSGEHYESMISEGIPKAIEWLNSLGR